ncbi:DUF1569 domain-containing protein [Planctomyces sp. SH-PL62]|uniref:DUF1569 domain-containing protein n=1 Tax=Planctomyces sp. SH-PL62 TaxID=1636152 RepID=UPI00078D39AE|nr:DUF1569 domain-containing protein [Planctomyces sp. SH-PL62]AMV40514.1 hypothetical protein VT85_24000 [Planctomyces sp. SH-PL62]
MTPGRRTLQFQDFQEIHADVERLLKGHTKLGAWSLSQVCDHLAATTRRAVETPADAPQDLSLRVGDARRDQVLTSGILPEGIPMPAGAAAPEDGDPREAAGRLREALAALEASPGPAAPHRLFGPLTKDQWRRLACIHCAHHLSFIIPADGGTV